MTDFQKLSIRPPSWSPNPYFLLPSEHLPQILHGQSNSSFSLHTINHLHPRAPNLWLLGIHFWMWRTALPAIRSPKARTWDASSTASCLSLLSSHPPHAYRYTQSIPKFLCFYCLPISWRPESRHWGRRGRPDTASQCHVPKIQKG